MGEIAFSKTGGAVATVFTQGTDERSGFWVKVKVRVSESKDDGLATDSEGIDADRMVDMP